jgi:type VI secretion system protein ImpJ
MTAHKLARIKWYIGQTLQPDHFLLQEEALLAEARLSARLRGLPSHGVARLGWNSQLLVQGELAIATLTVITGDNGIIDVPGNAMVAPLDLRAETSSCVSIYLHVLSQTDDAKGNRLYESDPRGVDRVMHRLLLSTAASDPSAVHSFKLMEVVRATSGEWQLSGSYVPPLASLGTSPFFADLLEDLSTLLTNFRREVLLHLADAYVARDQAAAVRRVVTQVQLFACMLDDMKQQVYPHPYTLFSSLRSLYFELCCFFEAEAESELPSYHHDAPHESLFGMTNLLKSRMGHVRARMRYASFERQAGSFTLAPLPQELFEATEIYFLVQRPDVKRAVPTDTIKLASPRRLPAVHRLALRGVAFESIAQLPFPNSFGPEIDFYRLDPNEEWSQVLNETALSFYARPEHEDVKFSLFWRA